MRLLSVSVVSHNSLTDILRHHIPTQDSHTRAFFQSTFFGSYVRYYVLPWRITKSWKFLRSLLSVQIDSHALEAFKLKSQLKHYTVIPLCRTSLACSTQEFGLWQCILFEFPTKSFRTDHRCEFSSLNSFHSDDPCQCNSRASHTLEFIQPRILFISTQLPEVQEETI